MKIPALILLASLVGQVPPPVPTPACQDPAQAAVICEDVLKYSDANVKLRAGLFTAGQAFQVCKVNEAALEAKLATRTATSTEIVIVEGPAGGQFLGIPWWGWVLFGAAGAGGVALGSRF